MTQEIKSIEIDKLILWTENPRDRVDADMTDKDIIKRATEQKQDKWNLKKFAQEMGGHYDFSEIPTVVKENEKYIVYDGNRRLAVIKCVQSHDWEMEIRRRNLFPSGNIPEAFISLTEVPCNVCDLQTALDNIERKRINSGSWDQLEKDYFSNKHRNRGKTPFLIIEESTGLISANKKMNQRFVAEKVLNEQNLKKIGFAIKNEELVSNYNSEKASEILEGITDLVESGSVTIGKYRGELDKELTESGIGGLSEFDDERAIPLEYRSAQRRTPRRKQKRKPFGGRLALVQGNTNNLYRDIEFLFKSMESKTTKLSENFSNITGMALRLLVEYASEESESRGDKLLLNEYVEKYFPEAKKNLSTDDKTTLSSQAISSPEKLIECLHMMAHSYTSASSKDKVFALSLIIGKMLEMSHRKP